MSEPKIAPLSSRAARLLQGERARVADGSLEERLLARLETTLPAGALDTIAAGAEGPAIQSPQAPTNTPAGHDAAASAVRWKIGAALVVGLLGGAAIEHARVAAVGPSAALSPAPAVSVSAQPAEPRHDDDASVPVVALSDLPSTSPQKLLAPSPHGTDASASDGRDVLLHEERSLLDRARTALGRRDSAAALEALREVDRRLSNPQLREEHDALVILALAQAGRAEEARQRAAAFHARYPKSMFSSSIARVTGDAQQ